MKALTSIVVGLDFSECSRAALIHAARFASWSHATVHPVHVVDAQINDMDEEAPVTAAELELHASAVEHAERQWDAFAAGVPGAGEFRLDVYVTHRLAGIRHQVDRYEANLLVLGAHGESKPHVGIGTLISSCIRDVPTDVLIARNG